MNRIWQLLEPKSCEKLSEEKGVGEMAQQLRIFAALSEVLSSVPQGS